MGRVAIFCDTNWSIGQMYRAIAHRIGADLIEWSRTSTPGHFDAYGGMFHQYDRILTVPMDGVRALVGYGIDRRKILRGSTR